MRVTSGLPKLILLLALYAALGGICAFAQQSGGKLTGKVTDKDGNPVPGVLVIVTNQTTADRSSKRTKAGGDYSFNLGAGAYRISVDAPYSARFDQGKMIEYGVYANLICDDKKVCTTLENVIIGGGDRKIDFVVANETAAEPGKPSDGKSGLDRRESIDRWRFEYPEYDRYGDKGARGRDIPFKRNDRWFNPYDRNVLKGDYPIIGDDIFMILTGVSTTWDPLESTCRHASLSIL